jgi:hypothetical protein
LNDGDSGLVMVILTPALTLLVEHLAEHGAG